MKNNNCIVVVLVNKKMYIYIYIYIYNSINYKHNTKITHKQNKLTFLVTRDPAWPSQIAFLLGLQVLTSGSSLLSPLMVGVGIKQNAKCEMLLRKIDG